MTEKTDPAIALSNRVNQSLGDELVRHKLITLETKEKAMPALKEFLMKGEVKRASLLKMLCWDLKEMEEKEVLDLQIEESNLGFCNLNHYTLKRDKLPPFKTSECWATMSVPVDFLEGVFFVATCNFLCPEVRDHWTRRLNLEIVWMLSDISGMTMTLEKLEKAEAEEQAEQEERKKMRKTRSPFGALSADSSTPFGTEILAKGSNGEEAAPEDPEAEEENHFSVPKHPWNKR